MIRHLLLLLTLLVPFSLFAQSKPILMIYTYNSFLSNWSAGPEIKQEFEKICECTVNITGVADGVALLNRIKMEGKRSKADIVLGLDTNLLAEAESTQLFAPHHIAVASSFKWENHYFIPFNYSYFAFIYNKEKITTPPRSFAEWLASPYTLIYSDPRVSTPGLGFLLWVQKLYGNESNNIWQKIAAKTITVTSGWSEAYGLFLKGEADFVLSYVTSPVYHLLHENDTRYAPAIFNEGHYPQIEIAGILASSKNQPLARAFLQFLLTPPIQTIIATKNVMYPVVATTLPEAFNALPKIDHSIQFSAQDVNNNKRKWLQIWRNALSQ